VTQSWPRDTQGDTNNVALQSLRMEGDNLWCRSCQKSETKDQEQDRFDSIEHTANNTASFRYRWFS
jgi:hypothetical protein